jgi:hypothetical protein
MINFLVNIIKTFVTRELSWIEKKYTTLNLRKM